MAGMFRDLRADEIECRVAQVDKDHKDAPEWITLLLYKDARCDMNILDETVGAFNWTREHSRENANCTVSIYNPDTRSWVYKEDTGTESRTESEKGLASDSFKRACVNWGIGRELYTAPTIFIRFDKSDPYNPKRDRFFVKGIETDGGVIRRLLIANQRTKEEAFYYIEEGYVPRAARGENG